MMNREIKIRAQRKYSEEWNYLNLSEFLTSDGHPQPDMLQYLHRNICQYTGLKDKNGVEVYEGDILENTFTVKNYDDDDYHLENRYPSQYQTKTIKDVVKFRKGEFRITSGVSFQNCKIIGNIHENPELLNK